MTSISIKMSDCLSLSCFIRLQTSQLDLQFTDSLHLLQYSYTNVLSACSCAYVNVHPHAHTHKKKNLDVFKSSVNTFLTLKTSQKRITRCHRVYAEL